MTEAISMPAQQCKLCDTDRGVYDFSRVCCMARFVCSIPLKSLRKGWMARFKARTGADVYAQLELTVKARWESKISIVTKEGNGAN